MKDIRQLTYNDILACEVNSLFETHALCVAVAADNVNDDHQEEDKAGTQGEYGNDVHFEEMKIGDCQIIEACRFAAFNLVQNKIWREVSEDEQSQTRHDQINALHSLARTVDNDRQALESYAHFDEQVEHGQTR